MINFEPILSNFGKVMIQIQKELVENQIFLISALDYYNCNKIIAINWLQFISNFCFIATFSGYKLYHGLDIIRSI